MKAKLKDFDEVREASPRVIEGSTYFIIYHSKSNSSLSIRLEGLHDFGNIVDLNNHVTTLKDRKIYNSKDGNAYYDEWFEWIGEEPLIVEPLEDSLWDISDW